MAKRPVWKEPPPKSKEPKQKTRQGLEIPVPKRDRFFEELDRTVKKRPPGSSESGSSSR